MERAKYTPQQVANYFIAMHKQENINLDLMKLLKLVYIAYAWYLSRTNEKLFDESIQAWRDGPVVPSLYHEFKHSPKKIKISSYGEEENSPPFIDTDDDEVNNVLFAVYDMYKDKDGFQLSQITHENKPWKEAIKKGYNAILDDADIKESAKIGIAKYIEKYGKEYEEA